MSTRRWRRTSKKLLLLLPLVLAVALPARADLEGFAEQSALIMADLPDAYLSWLDQVQDHADYLVNDAGLSPFCEIFDETYLHEPERGIPFVGTLVAKDVLFARATCLSDLMDEYTVQVRWAVRQFSKSSTFCSPAPAPCWKSKWENESPAGIPSTLGQAVVPVSDVHVYEEVGDAPVGIFHACFWFLQPFNQTSNKPAWKCTPPEPILPIAMLD